MSLIIFSNHTFAHCEGCRQNQCDLIPGILDGFHNGGGTFLGTSQDNEARILSFEIPLGLNSPNGFGYGWSQEFRCYRSWLSGFYDETGVAGATCADRNQPYEKTFFHGRVMTGLTIMTEELSAVGIKQMELLGRFFDAKHQLETQRLLQELQVEAHRDYYPSDDFCWFGTNARSLAASEEKARYDKLGLNAIQMTRQLGTGHASGGESRDVDKASRWKQFQEIYCDPKDNNWTTPNRDGLFFACGEINDAPEPLRANADIDFTRTIDEPKTLKINFADSAIQDDERDVLNLSHNLYGHNVLTRKAARTTLQYQEYQHLYMMLRSVAAKRNIALNSYNAIASLKAEGSSELGEAGGAQQFMRQIFVELGISSDEADKIIGENPSYYAQLEMLSMKIYQNPDFYSNLYDKPANIARKGVALQAIDLMLDRALYESELRQEMSLSVMLSAEQNNKFQKINSGFLTIIDTVGDQ